MCEHREVVRKLHALEQRMINPWFCYLCNEGPFELAPLKTMEQLKEKELQNRELQVEKEKLRDEVREAVANANSDRVRLREETYKLQESNRLNGELLDFCRDIEMNYDCDSDGHKYGTGCRCCKAKALREKFAERPKQEGEYKMHAIMCPALVGGACSCGQPVTIKR